MGNGTVVISVPLVFELLFVGVEWFLFIFLGRPSLLFKENRHFRWLTLHASQASQLSSKEG